MLSTWGNDCAGQIAFELSYKRVLKMKALDGIKKKFFLSKDRVLIQGNDSLWVRRGI